MINNQDGRSSTEPQESNIPKVIHLQWISKLLACTAQVFWFTQLARLYILQSSTTHQYIGANSFFLLRQFSQLPWQGTKRQYEVSWWQGWHHILLFNFKIRNPIANSSNFIMTHGSPPAQPIMPRHQLNLRTHWAFLSVWCQSTSIYMTASIIIINWWLLGHGFFALGELVTPAPVVRSQHFITHVTQEVERQTRVIYVKGAPG